MLCEMVSTRLKKHTMTGKTVAITVRYSDFKSATKRATGNDYINGGNEIYSVSRRLLDEFLPLKKKVRLLGISVSSLIQDTGQMQLFETDSKEKKLNDVVYELNRKFGEFSIKPANLIIAENFGTKEKKNQKRENIFDKKKKQ